MLEKTPSVSAFPNPFGDRTWNDVRDRIHVKLSMRWPRWDYADLEDAVSSAMVDLCDYWVGLDSSISEDTSRNFNYAVWRGTLYAAAIQGQRYRESTGLEPLEEMLTEENAGVLNRQTTTFGHEPSAEELVVEKAEMEALRAAIESMPETDFESWLGDWLNGLSAREAAKQQGVSSRTIDGLRKNGVNRIKQRMVA